MLLDGATKGVSQYVDVMAQWCIFFSALFLFGHGGGYVFLIKQKSTTISNFLITIPDVSLDRDSYKVSRGKILPIKPLERSIAYVPLPHLKQQTFVSQFGGVLQVLKS